jgi:hypothetical protein
METIHKTSLTNLLNITRAIFSRWPVRFALLILAVTAVVKWQATQMPSVTSQPSQALPPVNAKDYFFRATRLLSSDIDHVAPNDARQSQIATNGYPNNSYWAFTPSQKDAIVDESTPAFDEIEQGLYHPYQDSVAPSFSTLFSYFADYRRLARALRVAAETRASHGKWNDAMRYDLDAINLGADVPRGSVMFGTFVGIACQETGRKDIYQIMGHLDAAQSEASGRRLLQIDSLTPPPYQILTNDTDFCEGAMLGIFRTKQWHEAIMALGWSQDGASDNWINRLILSVESPKTAYDNYSSYSKKIIAIAKLPWPFQLHTSNPTAPQDPVNRNMDSRLFRGLVFKTYTTEALNRLLATQLALRAYHLVFSRYPVNLDDLVPKYLPLVPTDPFSDGRPLEYRLAGSTYILYSVGPDGVDDGGQPIYGSTENDKTYVVSSQSEKGDIVAGINEYCD